jgi:bifunctional non-homologous end joining protein LigD
MAIAELLSNKKNFPSCVLRNTQGSSNKVYQVQLIAQQDISNDPYGENPFYVNFQYGRYGASLVGGTKTPNGTTHASALKIYAKLVHSKQAKGYNVVKGVASAYTPALPVSPAKVRTGFFPQLLNQVTLEEAIALYMGYPNDIYMQTKWDGERRGIEITDKVVASNRTGFETSIQQMVSDACLTLTAQWDFPFEFDSEDMGGHLRIFDILQTNDKNLRDFGFSTRQVYLPATRMAIRSLGLQHQLKVDMPFKPATLEQFIAFIDQARAGNEEGVVIRIGEGPYTPGKPNSGGYVFKLKFVEDATVRVLKINDRRSVAMELYDGRNWISVGNVSIPTNKTIPNISDLVDVKYLYAYKGGSLYQPIYKGPRTDIQPGDANTRQLKYKKES